MRTVACFSNIYRFGSGLSVWLPTSTSYRFDSYRVCDGLQGKSARFGGILSGAVWFRFAFRIYLVSVFFQFPPLILQACAF